MAYTRLVLHDTIELIVRAAYALLVLGAVVRLLRSGEPLGAAVVAAAGIAGRRLVESGRLRRLLRQA